MWSMRFALLALVWFSTSLCKAQVELLPGQSDPDEKPQASLLLGAYVETFWQWNFNRPDNGVTNYRAFDNRHNSFTLSNVAIDVQWDWANVLGRIALQVGHTPSTYYLAEPRSSGSSGANESSAELWKYVQQANGGYRFALGGMALAVEAGIFLSPIGPESMVVHENWHWSRSNLFFGLPFYHTGARATLALSPAWSLVVAAFNGWNSVVDNNANKSLVVQAKYAPDSSFAASALYFAGVERTPAAAEGDAFRHMLDTHVTADLLPSLAIMAELNGGYEPSRLGPAGWLAGALSLRFAPHEQLTFALRGDHLREWMPEQGGVTASPMFFPSEWVSSGTLTCGYQPSDHVSFRLEYRHDHAQAPMYFRGKVVEEEADARRQDTILLGATAWL
jgi:hypothetical protein